MQKVHGKFLWLMVDKSVILTENMRQKENADSADFINLLSCLWQGRCTYSDYDTLSSLVVSKLPIPTANPMWKNSPVIVTKNNVKDRMNMQMAKEFANATKQDLHSYYAVDRQQGQHISDPDLVNSLCNSNSNDNSQQLGDLPLAIGMPVVLLQNLDICHGVVNGSTGFLTQIQYEFNDFGECEATSCIVKFNNCVAPAMSNLETGEMPITPTTLGVQFKNPFSKIRTSMRRTQLPIAPVFVITAHKLQSSSYNAGTIDLQSCTGTEKPYVMLSRFRTLKHVHILRPFDFKKITCHPSEDIRKEQLRSERLAEETKQSHLQLFPSSIAIVMDNTDMTVKQQLDFIEAADRQGSSRKDAGATLPQKKYKWPLFATDQSTLQTNPKRCKLPP